jgi:hypothetical protein
MAVTFSEPMQRVRELEKQESSGFFKFNHMWNRMRSYWKAIDEEGINTRYAVHQVPYQMLPSGFLDEENVNEARRTMSSIEFMMEYEAAMVSDSDGFFKGSMLEQCTTGSKFTLKLRGDAGKEYVMGVDPNQGGTAACGVIIIEAGSPHKIVYVKELKKKTTQDMVMALQKLTDRFNITRIFMDSQGGGKPIRDLLQEGYNNHERIIDIEDESMLGKSGKKILQLVNPTTAWISDANFDTLALFEHKELRFPIKPLFGGDIAVKLDEEYDEVKLLKSQLLNIIVTQTPRGVRHFDTPRKGQNKDLYSALVLAAWGVRELYRESLEPHKYIHPNGLTRPHEPGAKFAVPAAPSGKEYLKEAVLTRQK